MVWKETFIFQNFPTQQIHRMALEIGLWVYDEAPRLSTQTAQPICEALISIQSARERNTDFWPLRPPPTSPQARRKSLNDLIETHGLRQEMGRLQQQQPHQQQQPEPRQAAKQQQASSRPTLEAKYPGEGSNSPGGYTRERSSSNRNLPEANKLPRAQPRRASDEVATSSSHRLCARISPAPSRRSISVMNVGDGLLSRPSSRLGSQSNIMKIRRESGVGHSGQARGLGATSATAVTTSSCGSDGRYNSSPASQTPPISVTPTGRRSSLAGIQSMAGYRSQKNSQSGSTDQDSPIGRQAATIATSSSSSSAGKRSQSAATASSELMARYKMGTGHRASNAGFESSYLPATAGSATSSAPARRESNAIEANQQLQRKGSFAMQTLRKLKRTMSLNKGNGGEHGANQDSRRSSSSSTDYSASDVGEDVGVAQRLVAHQHGLVGKLKLTFVLTKGQLEVDVVAGKELKFDQEAALGIYVKIYLKGKMKSNKRKTRVVQPCDCPVFKHLIKYDGSLVDNKSLEVSVWQRQGGLKGKSPIGFTEIRLNELKLDRLQTSWYNLRPMDIVCSSSIDD